MSSDLRRIGLGLALLGLGACADFSRGAPSPVPDAGPADAGQGGDAAGTEGGPSLSFAADVYGLLVPTCQRCHSSGNEAGGTRLLFTGTAGADYATVTMFVDTQTPSSSRLLAKMSGNGHQGGTVYAAGSPEYLTVLHWIQQGAPP